MVACSFKGGSAFPLSDIVGLSRYRLVDLEAYADRFQGSVQKQMVRVRFTLHRSLARARGRRFLVPDDVQHSIRFLLTGLLLAELHASENADNEEGLLHSNALVSTSGSVDGPTPLVSASAAGQPAGIAVTGRVGRLPRTATSAEITGRT